MSSIHSDEEDDENHDDAITSDEDSSTFSAEVESGVRKIEAISQTWSKWGLIFAYIGYAICIFQLISPPDGIVFCLSADYTKPASC